MPKANDYISKGSDPKVLIRTEKGFVGSQTTGQIGFKLKVQNWVKSPESLNTCKIGFTYISLVSDKK